VLPDDKVLSGTVDQTTVTNDNGSAQLHAVVKSDALTGSSLGALNQQGTPVQTTLHLRDDGILAGPSDVLFSFLRKIGLK